MILGAHVSTAGGLQKSPGNGVELGCQAIQIFTRNQRQWKAKPLSGAEVEGFRQELSRSGIRSTAAHASYLLNMGSPETAALIRSREAFRQELERCEQLGIHYLIVHPGAHRGAGRPAHGCGQPQSRSGARARLSDPDFVGNDSRAGQSFGISLRASGGDPRTAS